MKGYVSLALCAVALCTAVARGSGSPPQRAVLSDDAMQHIVGGIGTATINIPFPQSVVVSDLVQNDVKWNQPGNRCQFKCCTLGATNVGFNINTFI